MATFLKLALAFCLMAMVAAEQRKLTSGMLQDRQCHEWDHAQHQTSLKWQSTPLLACCGKNKKIAETLCRGMGAPKPADPSHHQVCGVDSHTQSVCCHLGGYTCAIKPTVAAAYDALENKKLLTATANIKDAAHGPVGE